MISIKDTYDAPDVSRNTTALGRYDSKALINRINQYTLPYTHTHGHPSTHTHTELCTCLLTYLLQTRPV